MDTLPNDLDRLAQQVGQQLGNAAILHFPPDGQLVPVTAIDALAEMFQVAIAEAIQSWIDAGSERDVTMENEELFRVIRSELHGWSNDPALRG